MINTLDFAKEMDDKDELHSFRSLFYFPRHHDKEVIYFTGNSLGLQPKSTASYIQQELDDWKTFGVEGHFKARNPWFSYHEILAASTARIVGALPSEVVCMNQLTVNLHLLMVSFYRPTQHRYKIICEAKAFPSDQYALESQARFHGFNPDNAIIEIMPREGESIIRTEDLLAEIEKNKDSLALVMIGGVNYFTGQLFDIEKITAAAHGAGALAGWDLAHAAGNVPLQLHDWNVDFAAWCTYKYLNSGPGSVAGAFVHERHFKSDLPRFAGWWGHNKAERFKMEKGFSAIESAEGWQLSNAPLLSMAAHKASLDIFEKAGMEKLVNKSEKLTAFLEFIIRDINNNLSGKKNYPLEIITPEDKKQRGAQLSVVAHDMGKELFYSLQADGVITDWREPNVIRLAPVPLYNSFEDMFQFGVLLKNAIEKIKQKNLI